MNSHEYISIYSSIIKTYRNSMLAQAMWDDSALYAQYNNNT